MSVNVVSRVVPSLTQERESPGVVAHTRQSQEDAGLPGASAPSPLTDSCLSSEISRERQAETPTGSLLGGHAP